MKSFHFYFVLWIIVMRILILVDFSYCVGLTDTLTIELELTGIRLSPSNVHLENKIRQQFVKFKTIEMSYLMGEIDFGFTISCFSNCPSKWSFDNMKYLMSESSLHIFPSRTFGNNFHEFKSDLEIEASMSNNSLSNSHRASQLTGKYSCECMNDTTQEKHFYGYFHSDQFNTFVYTGNKLQFLRVDPGNIWVGLGCTTQTPNPSISLWMKKYGDKNNVWDHLEPGEKVKRDKSQGFIVYVSSASTKGADYQCRDENSTSILEISLVLHTGDDPSVITNFITTLTYNATENTYDCCGNSRYNVGSVPFVSFVNCNNLDECNFIANRRFPNRLIGGKCYKNSNFGNCCTHSAPRNWGLLQCLELQFGLYIYEEPFISSGIIINDSRNISRKPQIRDLKDENVLSLECTASSFSFSNNLHWNVQLRNGSTMSLNNHFVTQNSTRNEKDGTIKSTIRIPNEVKVENVSCLAPVVGAIGWKSETHFLEQIDTKSWITTIIVVSLTVPFVGVTFMLFFIRRLSKPPSVLTKQDVNEFINGVLPDHSQLTQEIMDKDIGDHCDYYCNLLKLPYNEELEFPRSCFNYDKKSNKLGEGAFGVVYPGILKIAENETEEVAIKMVLSNVTRDKMKSMLDEIKIMSYIGIHPNVVSLKGAFTRHIREGKVMMAVELCTQGSLLDFITKNKMSFNVGLKLNYIFGSRDLIRWASGIADGMEFLSSKKVIHMDLAARNILLNSSLVPKIGDFGLSRQLYTQEMYKKKVDSNGYFPIYWMSLESLNTLTFSIQSDIWSYGILLWEMFTLCEMPYRSKNGRELNWDELVSFLSSGRRLSKPDLSSFEIYDVMYECWNENPIIRPSFTLLKQFFKNELNKFPISMDLTQNPNTLITNHSQSNSSTTEFTNPKENIPMNPIVSHPYVASNFLSEDLSSNADMTPVMCSTTDDVLPEYDTSQLNSSVTSNKPGNKPGYVTADFFNSPITKPIENKASTCLNIKHGYVSADFKPD